MNQKERMKYLRGFRYQQTVTEVNRLARLAEKLRAELIENNQNPQEILKFDYAHGAEVKKNE